MQNELDSYSSWRSVDTTFAAVESAAPRHQEVAIICDDTDPGQTASAFGAVPTTEWLAQWATQHVSADAVTVNRFEIGTSARFECAARTPRVYGVRHVLRAAQHGHVFVRFAEACLELAVSTPPGAVVIVVVTRPDHVTVAHALAQLPGIRVGLLVARGVVPASVAAAFAPRAWIVQYEFGRLIADGAEIVRHTRAIGVQL